MCELNITHSRGTRLFSPSAKKIDPRRFSLPGILHNKLSGKRVKFDHAPIEEGEDDNPVLEKLNEKLYVTFADMNDYDFDGGHVNSIYQSNEKEQNRYFASSFGKKGKAKGEYEDAKDITILSDGRLLISDLINNRINLCNTSGRLLLLYTGTDLSEPWATAAMDNNLFAMTSCKNKCVRIMSVEGEIISSFGEGFFKCPTGIAVDSTGQFIVCDAISNTVSMHSETGQFLRYLGNSETKEHRFLKPRYVCVSNTGKIIVSDSGNHKIKVFDSNGDFIRSFGSYGTGYSQLKVPYGVCTNKYGEIFVADHYNSRISTFTSDGVFIRHLVTAGQGLRHPQGIAINSDMCLYVTHGCLKANETLIFHLNSPNVYQNAEFITHM